MMVTRGNEGDRGNGFTGATEEQKRTESRHFLRSLRGLRGSETPCVSVPPCLRVNPCPPSISASSNWHTIRNPDERRNGWRIHSDTDRPVSMVDLRPALLGFGDQLHR